MCVINKNQTTPGTSAVSGKFPLTDVLLEGKSSLRRNAKTFYP